MRGAAYITNLQIQVGPISIHAPHAGSGSSNKPYINVVYISIHAPHAGSGTTDLTCATLLMIFQSTLPMRGAAGKVAGKAINVNIFQSTLPMRGAAKTNAIGSPRRTISIHAPHAGSGILVANQTIHYNYFNPRSPCGERPRRTSLPTDM